MVDFRKLKLPLNEFWKYFTFENVKNFQNSKFRATEMVRMAVFDLLKSATIDFTQIQSGRKIAKFPHCAILHNFKRPVILGTLFIFGQKFDK